MNEELINKILEGIAKDEGTEGRAVALEGGGSTRGYGITTIAEGLKKALSFSNLNADEMSDKDLARQIVIYNIGEMKKDIGEETWNNLPDQMKIVASDQYYNSGKLFDGFKGDLISGNYENALKNTLDIISANDPKTGTNGVMTGLINRRVSKYNEAAEALGFNQITNFTTGNSVEEGKQTAVTYNYNNSDPFIVNTISGMHSQSLKKTDKSFLGDRTSILSEAASNALEQVQEFIPEEIKAPITEVVTPIAEAVTPIVDSLELPVEENVGSAPGFSKTLEEAKILNTERARLDKIVDFKELKNLVIALGAGIGDTFKLDKLRYHRIILMNDADVDGEHITTLGLTFFFRHLPQIVENGFLYVAMPPLFKLSYNKQTEYLYTEEEKNERIKMILKQNKGEPSG